MLLQQLFKVTSSSKVALFYGTIQKRRILLGWTWTCLEKSARTNGREYREENGRNRVSLTVDSRRRSEFVHTLEKGSQRPPTIDRNIEDV